MTNPPPSGCGTGRLQWLGESANAVSHRLSSPRNLNQWKFFGEISVGSIPRVRSRLRARGGRGTRWMSWTAASATCVVANYVMLCYVMTKLHTCDSASSRAPRMFVPLPDVHRPGACTAARAHVERSADGADIFSLLLLDSGKK